MTSRKLRTAARLRPGRPASFDTGSPASIRWEAMDDTVTQQDAADQATADQRVEELLDDELLVEEISIDGMCGVY